MSSYEGIVTHIEIDHNGWDFTSRPSTATVGVRLIYGEGELSLQMPMNALPVIGARLRVSVEFVNEKVDA